MIEAELKARVADPEHVMAALEKRSTARVEVYQDGYYDLPDGSLMAGDRELRVRTVHGPDSTRSVLTYKEARVDEASGSKPEHETAVEDPGAVHAMLRGLGYVPAISFEKRCRNYEFEAAGRRMLATLVRVPEIDGTFIELETLVEEHELQAALGDVRAVLAELGIEGSDLTTEAYTDAVAARRSGRGGHALEDSPAGQAARGNLSGVWLSRYQYYSSGREDTYTGQHFVVVLQHGNRLTVRSLPGSSDSPLTMDLTVDGNVITGTWVEQTADDGYYRGARYHGAIQMLAEPTGRRIVGKWVGFGKEMDVNTGPWELVFQSASTNKATLERYNRRP